VRCVSSPVLLFVGLLQVHEASVLFLDNPVGAGFSYVDESVANYTTNIHEITDDLISFTRNFVQLFPPLKVRSYTLIVCTSESRSHGLYAALKIKTRRRSESAYIRQLNFVQNNGP